MTMGYLSLAVDAFGLRMALGAEAVQRGAIPVEVFDAQSVDEASTSTRVAQQADGRLLVANRRGLFRFDRFRWQLHLYPEQKGGMEYLAIDAEGLIHTYASGFESLSGFTRSFKLRFGVPPSQLRADSA
jgi:hypothetical protein